MIRTLTILGGYRDHSFGTYLCAVKNRSYWYKTGSGLLFAMLVCGLNPGVGFSGGISVKR